MMVEFNPPTTRPMTSSASLRPCPGRDEAWETFLERYGPLHRRPVPGGGLQRADVDDIGAAVCTQLVESCSGVSGGDPSAALLADIFSGRSTTQSTPHRAHAPASAGRAGSASASTRLGARPTPRQSRSQGWGRARRPDPGPRRTACSGRLDRVRFEVGLEAWAAFRSRRSRVSRETRRPVGSASHRRRCTWPRAACWPASAPRRKLIPTSDPGARQGR